MSEPRYTVRLRYAGRRGVVAFVVEDEDGDAYIYGRAGLCCRLARGGALPRRVPTLHRLGWVPVPAVAPYTLAGLRRLLGFVADRVA